MSKIEILSALEVSGQFPLDSKLYFTTIAELKDLGTNNIKAFKYYSDMIVTCAETHKQYIWRKVKSNTEIGIIENHYTYPNGAIAGGIDYSNQVYNFFPLANLEEKGRDGVDGKDGIDGINGQNGIDGINADNNGTYTWNKYSANSDGTDMTDTIQEDTVYIGLSYNNPTPDESDNKEDYTWGLLTDTQFWEDAQGLIHWTWIKYADSLIEPYGLSDIGAGKKYIGFAYDKSTQEESNNFHDYIWSQQLEGVPISGTNKYLWIKFADNNQGSGISDFIKNKNYIGLAYDQTSPIESSNPADYRWGLISGDNTDAEGKFTHIKFASTPNVAIFDSPISNLYIGISVGNDTNTETNNYLDYQWILLNDAVVGTIEPIKEKYVWVKYSTSANPIQSDMSDSPIGKTYIGLAFNKETDVESINPSDYFWSLIQGAQGYVGADGKQYYIWTKYAPNGTPTDGEISDVPTGNTHIGFAFNKTTDVESTSAQDYEWSLLSNEGILQQPKWTYIWVKFADDSNGNGISDSPLNKLFMGIAYDKDTNVESLDPTDYVWNPIQGEQGYTGQDGRTYYTWIKYADTPTSLILSDSYANRKWMGLAFNKESAEESTDYRDYTWYPFYDGAKDNDLIVDQNNIIRTIDIPSGSLSQISEQGIADWLNERENPLVVADNEIIAFVIDGFVNNIPVLDLGKSVDLTYKDITNTSVVLDWNNNGDLAIVRHTIYFKRTKGGGDILITTGNINTFNLEDLEAGKEYEVYIKAFDSLGNSKVSNTVTFTTSIDLSATTPIINVTEVTATSIAFDYDIASSFGVTTWQVWKDGVKVYEGNASSFSISGLTPNTEYDFYVVAFNGVTPSNNSLVETIATLDAIAPSLTAPVIDLLLVDNNKIEFNITVPYLELSRLTGFYILYRKVGDSTWITRFGDNSTLKTIVNLLQDTSYEVKVQSTDSISISADSNVLLVTTTNSKGVGIRINHLATYLYESIGVAPDYLHSVPFKHRLELFGGKPNSVVRIQVTGVPYDGGAPIYIQNVGVLGTPNSPFYKNVPKTAFYNITLDNAGNFNTLIDINYNALSLEGAMTVTATVITSENGIDTDYIQSSFNY